MSEHGMKTVADIVDNMVAFWRTAILKAGLELHIGEHVAAGRTTAQAVAEAEGTDPRATEVLMDALCGLGFLDKEDGRYLLEPFVQRVLPALRRMTPFALDPDSFATWNRLPEAVRAGGPLRVRPEYWENFARSTQDLARGQGARLAARLANGDRNGDRRGTRVVDVGCGSGGVGFGMALADPEVHVTGLDSAAVIAIAAQHASQLGIAERVTLRAVDVVEAESLGPPEFDLAILANMLHLFDPAGNRALLPKVAALLAPGGKVVIQEIVADDERRRAVYPLTFAVELLMSTAVGTVHTLPEISSWLTEAGFGQVEESTVGHVTTITAMK